MTSIFHITHLDNLSRMAVTGSLLCDRTVRDKGMNAVSIAHDSIKARREETRVPLGPGDTLSAYVPFYFAPRSPMLFTISRGNVEGHTDGQSRIVHLHCTAEAIEAARLPFVFSDGHAIMALSRFFVDLADLPNVDWTVMSLAQWNDTLAEPDRKRRRQAEFLVHAAVPWTLVDGIGVMAESVATEVRAILAKAGSHAPPVSVRRNWYY